MSFARDIYTIDLADGTGTLVGATGETAIIRGLTFVVPEPSHALLVLVGLMVLGLRRR